MLRIVVWSFFAAGADDLDELLEKIAGVLAAHSGSRAVDGGTVASVLTVEEVDDLPDDVEDWFPVVTRDAFRVIVLGAAGTWDRDG